MISPQGVAAAKKENYESPQATSWAIGWQAG